MSVNHGDTAYAAPSVSSSAHDPNFVATAINDPATRTEEVAWDPQSIASELLEQLNSAEMYALIEIPHDLIHRVNFRPLMTELGDACEERHVKIKMIVNDVDGFAVPDAATRILDVLRESGVEQMFCGISKGPASPKRFA